MLSFFRKRKNNEFKPTGPMMKAAILKGQRIGLQRAEIIEMISLMDKSKSKRKVTRIVDEILANSS